VSDPSACYALENLSPEAQELYACEPLTAGDAPLLRLPPPQIARLDNGMLYGLSFLPVTAEGKASPTGFVHNPLVLWKMLHPEDTASVPVGAGNALLGCFDGVDEFDEGILIGDNRNFGHWLLNHLTRLALVASIPGHERLPLLVGETIGSAQLECLAHLGYPPSRLIRLRKGRLARFRRLWAPMMPLCAGPDGRLYWSPQSLAFVRRGLGVSAQSRPRPGKRIFISRQGAKWRRLLNEDVVRTMLSAWGFQAVDPGTLSIAQQVELAADAEVICGSIGAGMSLVAFAPAGTKVVELKYRSSDGITMLFPAICQWLGQPWGEVRGSPLVQEGVNPLNYDFMVPAHLVTDALAALGVAK
jgi:glycosyl transferase family 61